VDISVLGQTAQEMTMAQTWATNIGYTGPAEDVWTQYQSFLLAQKEKAKIMKKVNIQKTRAYATGYDIPLETGFGAGAIISIVLIGGLGLWLMAR